MDDTTATSTRPMSTEQPLPELWGLKEHLDEHLRRLHRGGLEAKHGTFSRRTAHDWIPFSPLCFCADRLGPRVCAPASPSLPDGARRCPFLSLGGVLSLMMQPLWDRNHSPRSSWTHWRLRDGLNGSPGGLWGVESVRPIRAYAEME